MDEVLRQAAQIARGAWKYRWLGMLVAWAVGVFGIVTINFIPNKYEASARIYVNTESILKPLMVGMTVQPNDTQRIAMLSRIVISRPNIEKIAHTVGLDAQAASKNDAEKLIDDILKVLSIKDAGGANLYVLSYRDILPDRAKRVVELLASAFIESGQGGKVADAESAKKFLDDQIAAYEQKLQEGEDRLKEFRLRNLGMNPGDGKDFFSRISELGNLLNQAQLELRQAETSRDAFKRVLDKEESDLTPDATASVNSGGSLAEIDARIDGVKRNLDSLLLRYTDNHPDVIGARRVIKDLEEQRLKIRAARKSENIPAPQPAGGGPRAVEQLKVSLAGAEASIAAARSRVAEYTERMTRLKEVARLMPQVDVEFAQLNRDYEITKKSYESLVSRRQSATMSSEMQAVSGIADFRLIDPPRVAPRPVAPNRLLLLPGSLILALAAGFAAAFFAMELHRTFNDSQALRVATGLPILGTVSTIMNEAMKRKKRRGLIRFLSGFGMFLGMYVAAFLYVYLQSSRLA